MLQFSKNTDSLGVLFGSVDGLLFLFWWVMKFPKYLWEIEAHLGKKGGNEPIDMRGVHKEIPKNPNSLKLVYQCSYQYILIELL